MVIAALLGHGAPAFIGLFGTTPILTPEQLAILGDDDADIHPQERSLLDLPLAHFDSQQLHADPIGVATAALRHMSGEPPLVHFDVDAVDSADLPLANYPTTDSVSPSTPRSPPCNTSAVDRTLIGRRVVCVPIRALGCGTRAQQHNGGDSADR
jgi:hypothetical protein